MHVTVAMKSFQTRQASRAGMKGCKRSQEMWAVAPMGVKGSQGVRRWLGQDWRISQHVTMAVKVGKAPKGGEFVGNRRAPT